MGMVRGALVAAITGSGLVHNQIPTKNLRCAHHHPGESVRARRFRITSNAITAHTVVFSQPASRLMKGAGKQQVWWWLQCTEGKF